MQSEPKKLAYRVETLTTKWVVSLVVGFWALVLVAIIVGTTGPSLWETKSSQVADHPIKCTGPGCQAKWSARLVDMSPMQQIMYITAQMVKPVTSESGSELVGMSMNFDVSFEVAVTAKLDDSTYATLSDNSTHTRRISCPAHGSLCSPISVFALSHIAYSEYRVDVIFTLPTEAFVQRKLQNVIEMHFEFHYINRAYTSFEVGWKYFFAAVSLLIAVIYTVAVLRARSPAARGAGASGLFRGSGGRRLTFEQQWSMVLLWGLVLFNDPFKLAAIYNADVAWPGLNVFFSVTFLAAIFFYWLCEFHIIAKAADTKVTTSERVERTGTFYLFKAILMTLFWTFTVLLSMYTLYRLETDPAFSLWENSEYRNLLFGFAFFLAAVYNLWVFILFVLSVRSFSQLPRHMRFFLILSVSAVASVLGTYYAGGTSPKPDNTATFLIFYTVVNLYVWIHSYAFLPDRKSLELDDQLERERAENLAAAREGVGPQSVPITILSNPDDAGALDSGVELSAPTATTNGGGGGGGGGGGAGSAAKARTPNESRYIIEDDASL